MKPRVSALTPSVPTRKIGSRPWIISEEVSINRLTMPSTQTLRGSGWAKLRGSGDAAIRGYRRRVITSGRFGLRLARALQQCMPDVCNHQVHFFRRDAEVRRE